MSSGYSIFDGMWGEHALLARDVLNMKPAQGIPSWLINLMDVPLLEEIAGYEAGAYHEKPEEVYVAFQRNIGACFLDQYIPRNPLTMTQSGFDAGTEHRATTGAREIICDGMQIDSPEAVIEHMETFVFPRCEQAIAACHNRKASKIRALIEQEVATQRELGMNILKGPYAGGFQTFPHLRYGMYGYESYMMAYALYPEVMEKDFSLQADLAVKHNEIGAAAIIEGGLPRVLRSDHDMADSRSMLVDIKSLDRIWFPHFERAVQPLFDAGIRLLWHCDGNLMDMVPRLIEVGLGGFQGFQYEDGMDYEAICRMTDRNGDPLMIIAGVSVTSTLPFGSPDDVVKEMKWLVEHGPGVGLVLGCSSSITPNTSSENVRTMLEGLKYYREHGRN